MNSNEIKNVFEYRPANICGICFYLFSVRIAFGFGGVKGRTRVVRSQSKKCKCCAKLKDFEKRFKARQEAEAQASN